jgi:hypothetical protein
LRLSTKRLYQIVHAVPALKKSYLRSYPALQILSLFFLLFSLCRTAVAQTDPVHVGSFACTPKDVVIVGNYAYVADGSSLNIVDVSNPATPWLASSIACSASAVAVSGSYAYVAGTGIEVINVSDPTHPVSVTKLLNGVEGTALSLSSVQISGDYAIGLNPKYSIKFYPELSVYDATASLEIIDIKNPTSPIPAGRFIWYAGTTYSFQLGKGSLHVSGNLAFCIGPFTVKSIDISEPTAPVLKASVGSSLGISPQAHRSGDYFYVGLYDVFSVFELSPSGSMTQVGKLENGKDNFVGVTIGISVAGSYAVVGTSQPNAPAASKYAIQIINISDPFAPTVVGKTTSSLAINRIFTKGDYAYAATANSLEIYQLPAQPSSSALSIALIPSKKYGDPPFQVTATSTSSEPVNFASSDESVATVSGNTVTIVKAGSTKIHAWQGSDPNDPSLSATRTLFIRKAAQTLTFDPIPDKTIGDPPFKLFATTSSGLKPKFEIPFYNISLAGPDQDSVKLGTVPGRYFIEATQPGNENYSAITLQSGGITRAFCLKPVKPTLTYNEDSHTLLSSAESGNQWFLNGNALDGASLRTLVVDQSGEYTVAVKINNCTSDPSDEVLVSITSIEDEVKNQQDIHLYPNPSSKNLTIKFRDQNTTEILNIKIIDLLGNKIFEGTLEAKPLLEVDISNYPTGAYLIQIHQSKGVFHKRFVKL